LTKGRMLTKRCVVGRAMNSHVHPQSPSQVSDRASAQALFKDVFAGPELFLSSLDVTGNTMSFTPMSLETYRSSDFLDHRMHRTAGSDIKLDSNTFVALFDRFNPEQKPLSFIFHTGYCCSTLLARCLENLNQTLVLKEPAPLRRLSECWFTKSQEYDLRKLNKIVGILLSRRFSEESVWFIFSRHLARSVEQQ